MATSPRYRFAPTPSRLLHVGNALAALIGWAEARLHGGRFILRIEDIDKARCRPKFEEACIQDLRWLGITWDEGPDIGGPFGPYRQSERIPLYDDVLKKLADEDRVYFCRCSRADITTAQRAPHGAGAGSRAYPGTCRELGHIPRGDESRGGYRLAVETLGVDAQVHWTDQALRDQVEDVRSTCGDFILGRTGAPSYQLAAVVDDIEMEISHVVRGQDLLGSTARQCLLYRELAAPRPHFLHHVLVVDEHGEKLSKRDAALSLAYYRHEGMTSHELIARLAQLIGVQVKARKEMTADAFLEDWAQRRQHAQHGVWTDGWLARHRDKVT